MKLTILGSGTSMPSALRVCSGYWVDVGPARLRLDCGAGTVHAMARSGLDWEALTHQFISHFHLDHVGELAQLLFTMKYGLTRPRTDPLRLSGPAGLRALLERVCDAYREELLTQRFPIELTELAPGEALPLGDGALLRVAKTPHTIESLACRIEHEGRSIGYTGDTGPSEELAAFFAGVDVLVAECSFLDRENASKHLTADLAADLAARAHAAHLVATHCYFDPEATHLRARLAHRFEGRITIARDGLVIEPD